MFEILSFKKSKKAQSTGYAWLYGLITLFGLGILFIVFDQVFLGHLVPIMKSTMNLSDGSPYEIDGATKNEVNNNIDRYMLYWHALPFIIFFVVVIYMIVAAIRKERENDF